MLNSNISSTRSHNMVNFSLLTAEICWRVWGTNANFNGFRVLASLLHGSIVLGVSQILRRWTQGATYIRQGGHQVGHWATYLVMAALCNRAGHYIFALWLVSIFFFLLLFPRLISAAADWMSTILPHMHGVALECRSEMCCTRLAGNTGRKKSPFWHHRTTLLGYIFGNKHVSTIGKNC